MNIKMEKSILQSLLKCINSQEKVIRRYKIMRYSFLLGPVIVLTIIYNTVFNFKNNHIDFFLIFFSGVFVGLSSLFRSAYHQIPIVTKYLNKEEIEKRLEELNKP